MVCERDSAALQKSSQGCNIQHIGPPSNRLRIRRLRPLGKMATIAKVCAVSQAEVMGRLPGHLESEIHAVVQRVARHFEFGKVGAANTEIVRRGRHTIHIKNIISNS